MIALAFEIAGERFAAPIGPIEEVLPYLPLEGVPGGASDLRGVVRVRGHVIPVLDAAARLGLGRSGPAPAEPPIIVFRVLRPPPGATGEGNRLVGLLVDDVADLVAIPEAAVAGAAALYVEGGVSGVVDVGGVLHRLIDPMRLL